MTRPVRRSARLLLVAALCASVPAAAQDEKPAATITPVKKRAAVFSGEETEFQFKVESTKAIKGTLVWRVALGSATYRDGRLALNVAPGTPANASIKVAGETKEGAVQQYRLTAWVYEAGQTKPAATYEQDLHVFPKNPFADRSEWLKKLKINLYDPKGDTAKVLKAADVPFEEARSVDAVADLKEGVVIVGEGTSFKEEKGLAAELQKRAAAGLVVLVLAPKDGEVIVPGVGAGGNPDDLTFRREPVRRLDKRLDPDGKAVASSIVIKNTDDGVVGEVTAGPGGWPWIEAHHGKGRWAVCGLAIVAKWDASPTPRFLLARILEHLTGSETEQPKKENE